VACIGSQQITEALFEHWSTIARKSGETPPKHPPATARAIMREVMTFLISSYWVLGEARDMHVHVSAREVRRKFDNLRKQQFPKHAEFERFLRQTGQNVSDLLLRVELNLLSQRIQRHVLAGHRRTHGRQQALAPFLSRIGRKWKAQTYCIPQNAVQECGHVQTTI
jgi:hypothetical protein